MSSGDAVRQAVIGGATLAWRESGAGDDLLVYLHGFPFSSAFWKPQLAAPPAGWRVVAPDLRGFGGSGPIPGNRVSMEQHARDVAGLIAHFAPRRAVVCGLSMGGYIAFAMLKHTPSALKGMILCDTRANADSPEGKQGRVKNAKHVHANGTASLIEAMVPRLLAPKTRIESPAVEQELRAIMSAASPQGVVAALLGMAERPDATPLLRNIGIPTLVITGEHDQVVPVGESRLMARAIRGAYFEIVPDAGHVPNLEQPEVFNRLVANFLNGSFAAS